MQSTQLVCPHCNSTLTFGVTISPGAAVECLICVRKFTAANPVAVTAAPGSKSAAAPKPKPKPAPTTFATTPLAPKPAKPRKPSAEVRAPVEANGNFLVVAVSIAVALLLTAGISFAVWKSMRSAEPGPSEPEGPKIVKNSGTKDPGEKKAPPVEGKKPDDGGGKPLAILDDEDERDLRAKVDAELKQELKRKPPSKIVGPDPPEMEIPAPPLPKKAVAGLDQEKIDAAIKKGVAHLMKMQTPEGKWTGGHDVGITALCGLTLLECKVPAGDRSVQRAADFVRSRCATLRDYNYEVSLAILFLDRLGDPRDHAVIQGLALRLMAGQDTAGGWTYSPPVLSPEEMFQLFAFMRPTAPLHIPDGKPKIQPLNDPFQRLRYLLITEGLDTDNQKVDLKIPPKVIRRGWWRGALIQENKNVEPKNPPKFNPAPPLMEPEALAPTLKDLPIVRNRGKRKGEMPFVPNTSSDNSNTQFVLLALWAARRHGVPTDEALLAGYQRFVMTQHSKDHGWSYGGPGPSTITMTCVGLIGLGIGHGAAPDREGADPKSALKPALQDLKIQAGLLALAGNIGQPSPDAKQTVFPMENPYFLWSVERVAMLYDLDKIGGKDWYGWGAQILIHNQRLDGAWQSDPKNTYTGSQPTLDTCFALLFLKRSNLVQDLTQNLRLNVGVRDP
jgi:hypothetical protein